MFAHINEVAVLVVAMLSVAIAHIWYSPLLFGGVWSRALGKNVMEKESSTQELYSMTAKAIFVGVILFGAIAWGISFLKDTIPLSTLSLFLFVLFVAYGTLIAVWEKRPATYILANGGYIALILFGGIGVIAYWPW